MNNGLTLTLWNAILPLAGLCALVALLPGWFAGRGNLSQARLSRAVGWTAVVTFVVGALLAAVLYAAINPGVWGQVLAAPVARAGFFLGRSGLFALLWGPVLGFVWLVKAQELNRRLGMRMVDEGGEGVIYAVMMIAVFVIPFFVGALAGARYSVGTCVLVGLGTVGGLIAIPLLQRELLPINSLPWLEDLSVSLAGVAVFGGWAMAGEFAAGMVFGRKNRRRSTAAEGLDE